MEEPRETSCCCGRDLCDISGYCRVAAIPETAEYPEGVSSVCDEGGHGADDIARCVGDTEADSAVGVSIDIVEGVAVCSLQSMYPHLPCATM